MLWYTQALRYMLRSTHCKQIDQARVVGSAAKNHSFAQLARGDRVSPAQVLVVSKDRLKVHCHAIQ